MKTREPQTEERMPSWLKRKIMYGSRQGDTVRTLREKKLNTVCKEARCPNRSECYSRGTATFMIMGRVCTRGCRFCAVESGVPGPLKGSEPEAVAKAAAEMNLGHIVVTSVTRDDLEDGGASHFARTIRAIKGRLPHSTVEVLIPDFQGNEGALITVMDAGPDVINHNVETVPRLYPRVRPQGDYARSLCLLDRAGEAGFVTKSGFMVGFGEGWEEVIELLRDLRDSGCEMVTVGQYLNPKVDSVSIHRFWEPGEFERIREEAYRLGFSGVAAGPLVRSSYLAEILYDDLISKESGGSVHLLGNTNICANRCT